MEKIVWTDRVRNEELLHGVREERNIIFFFFFFFFFFLISFTAQGGF
jgi:hypothetical protein